MASGSISRVIPWLDRFQRGRDVEGDVMLLRLGHADIFHTLGDQILPDERIVVIDAVGPGPFRGERGFISRHKTGLVVINEDPLDVVATDVMESEKDGYRLVSINEPQGTWDTHVLLSLAERLVVEGGLVLMTPWPGDPEESPGVSRGYWQYTNEKDSTLMRCGHVGDTLLMTNDRIWQKDYEAVLQAAKGSGDVREV